MNREQLLDMLAELAERYEETGGRIGVSEQQASRILEMYDRGEVEEEDLPLAVAAAISGRRAQLLLEAARRSTEALQSLAEDVSSGEVAYMDDIIDELEQQGEDDPSPAAIRQAAERIQDASFAAGDAGGSGRGPSLTIDIDDRRRFSVTILEDFDGDVFDDARGVIEGELPVRTWHERMLGRVRRHLLQQAELGKGRSLTAAELEDLQDVMDEQARRLKRFAEEIAARNQLADNAESAARRQLQQEGKEVTEEAVQELAGEFRAQRMTVQQVKARAQMYKGKGYEQFWRRSEENIEDDGVVVDYIAQDDASTCSPCQAAEAAGPYLPGQGPMPGGVCLGGGHCRCKRERREAPEVASDLREG